jgi:hypothetical protein
MRLAERTHLVGSVERKGQVLVVVIVLRFPRFGAAAGQAVVVVIVATEKPANLQSMEIPAVISDTHDTDNH